jgi:hypothetical protein
MAREIFNGGAKGPCPWAFALGSVESRAAARLKVARWFDSRKRLRFIWHISWAGQDSSRVSFGEWQEWQNGTLGQWVYVPSVWLKPGEEIPTCPDCGTPFKKTHEYPNLAGYQANCLDTHDPDRIAQMEREKFWLGAKASATV